MANECRGSLQLCATRVQKLDADGTSAVGAGNLFVTDAPLSLQYSFELEAGSDLVSKNGCGTPKVTYRNCDRIKSVSLTLVLTELDAALLAALTSGTVYTVGGTTVGYQVPETDAACSNGVSIEAFTKRMNGGAPDLTRGWWNHGFPKTTWVLGSQTLQDDILTFTLNGIGVENPGFYTGPTNEWPVPGLSNLYGFVAVATLPTVSCEPATLTGS